MDTRVALRSCVRVRPLSSEEEADGERSAWAVRGSSLRLLPKELQADGRAGWLADSEYSFDAAFGPEMGTHAVYAAAAGDVASTILSGTSCTLIAFGQTASGKTYTMLGSTAAHSASRNSANTSTPGLVVLAFRDIATRSEESSRLAGSVLGKSQHYRVKASCVEIYNEQCNDLLAINQRNLKLYEAPGGAQVVQNLTEVNIATETELLECMQVAQAQRRVGSTQNNDRSSRSHLIFSISVESWTIPSRQSDAYEAPMGKDESLTHTSTLRLADLAGSERVGVSRRQVEVASAQNASDVLQRESSQINKSLLTLSTIVHRLAEGTHAQHLPARAILISTITPSSRHVEESLNTLRFASRARRIRSISEAHSGSGPSQALVDKLSVEVALLRAQLQQHQGSSPLSVSLSSEPIEQDRANSALTSDAPLSSKVVALAHDLSWSNLRKWSKPPLSERGNARVRGPPPRLQERPWATPRPPLKLKGNSQWPPDSVTVTGDPSMG
ncbi:hypothetical protein AB1Y20_000868 [Prymnesium parvum]|uniref:Kinesin motor domain-containing protein n=1 Tax=Prymnesium parvum TaxID=97485 RepID=A0AB34K750_PRYPA